VKKCSQNIKTSLQNESEEEAAAAEKTYFWVTEPPIDSSLLPTPLCALDRKKGAIVGCVALKISSQVREESPLRCF
jgi:hypothetical protein